MKALQSIAMGLVVVALTAPQLGGYDTLPNPLGWVLVLLGVRALPEAISHRAVLLSTGWLAAAVSVPLWFPALTDGLYATDPSLAWAANLPQIAFTVVLCHCLAGAAAAHQDIRAARWWGLARTLALVVAGLPVLVFGAGMATLEVTSYLAAGLSALLVIWLLFAHASRAWALHPMAESAAK